MNQTPTTDYQLVGTAIHRENLRELLDHNPHPRARETKVSVGFKGLQKAQKRISLYGVDPHHMYISRGTDHFSLVTFESKSRNLMVHLSPLTWEECEQKASVLGFPLAKSTQYQLEKPVLICLDNFDGYHMKISTLRKEVAKIIHLIKKHQFTDFKIRLHPKNNPASQLHPKHQHLPSVVAQAFQKLAPTYEFDQDPWPVVRERYGLFVVQHSSLTYEIILSGLPLMILKSYPISSAEEVAYHSLEEYHDPQQREAYEQRRRTYICSLLKYATNSSQMKDPENPSLIPLLDEYWALQDQKRKRAKN